MGEAVTLPPGVAIAILAFLLSLLPAGLFLWLWYLRRQQRPVPASAIAVAFILGVMSVVPAFQLEKWAPTVWERLSPSTAHYYDQALLPLQTLADVLLPAVGTFFIVALVEEGVRYLVLLVWFRLSRVVDQVFDGLLVGVACGLGFATLENTIYFFTLFSQGSFDTLVFVFFLRFIISTLAHVGFGGIMGALLARGMFAPFTARHYFLQAFFVTWFLHGLYDWLLVVNQTMYAVVLLVPPLVLLIYWTEHREFLAVSREGRKILLQQKPPTTTAPVVSSSPWNVNAPWLKGGKKHG
jgi:RsiW-degrading membrane proteinase PrsW (M82 family)